MVPLRGLTSASGCKTPNILFCSTFTKAMLTCVPWSPIRINKNDYDQIKDLNQISFLVLFCIFLELSIKKQWPLPAIVRQSFILDILLSIQCVCVCMYECVCKSCFVILLTADPCVAFLSLWTHTYMCSTDINTTWSLICYSQHVVKKSQRFPKPHFCITSCFLHVIDRGTPTFVELFLN